MCPLLLAVAMTGQYFGSGFPPGMFTPNSPAAFELMDRMYPYRMPIPKYQEFRPHIIQVRVGFDAYVKQMEPANKRILAELNDGEVVYLQYANLTRFVGRPQPGDHIWVDTARYVVTVLPDENIPPLILSEKK